MLITDLTGPYCPIVKIGGFLKVFFIRRRLYRKVNVMEGNLKFSDSFCKDNFPEGAEYIDFEMRATIPKNKIKAVRKWTNAYHLNIVKFHDVGIGIDIVVRGEYLDGKDKLFDELLQTISPYLSVERRWFFRSIIAAGFPNTRERPITTALFPQQSIP